MKKYDVIIGIDPDTVKSGVAYLEPATRKLEAASLAFPQLLDYLKTVAGKSKKNGKSVIIVVEAGWLNTISNYHTTADRAGQRIAKNVGSNQQVGKLTVEMCRHYGLEVDEIKPLPKIWKGRDRKITHAELAQITGLIEKTSDQEQRDAALLAWNYSGLPIRLKF